MSESVIFSDVLPGLASLPAEWFHCAVTSPPYWQLRQYAGVDPTLWGDGQCVCLGAESDPDSFIRHLIEVFDGLRRVLRDDGVLFVNLGETYADDSKFGGQTGGKHVKGLHGDTGINRRRKSSGLESGNRAGVPERFALAMQSAGWTWRDTITWVKKSPMPLSRTGWFWRKCRVKAGKSERAANNYQTETGRGGAGVASRAQREAYFANGGNKWSPCPGCRKCIPNGGLVLRKGRFATTAACEPIFMFSKSQWHGPPRIAVPGEWKKWLAAMLDAEGCISIGRKSHPSSRESFYINISVANTCMAVMEKLVEIAGVGRIAERPGVNRPIYNWQVSCQQAESVLWEIRDHLIIKQRQCDVALSLQCLNDRIHRSGDDPDYLLKERMWHTIKALNQCRPDIDLSWLPQAKKRGGWRSADYFCDHIAASEPAVGGTPGNKRHKGAEAYANGDSKHRLAVGLTEMLAVEKRLPRSYFLLGSEPKKEKHFAAYPSEIPRRLIQMATSNGGCCATCGSPHAPIIETEQVTRERPNALTKRQHEEGTGNACPNDVASTRTVVLGYRATCKCEPLPTVPCRVIDPFCGTATTLFVAKHMGRDSVGIEASADYCEIANRRLSMPFTGWAGDKRKSTPKQPKLIPGQLSLLLD